MDYIEPFPITRTIHFFCLIRLHKNMWICDFAPLESNEDKWAWERSSDDCCDICWFLERKKHWFLRQLDIITHMPSVFLSLCSVHNALKSTIKFDFISGILDFQLLRWFDFATIDKNKLYSAEVRKCSVVWGLQNKPSYLVLYFFLHYFFHF